jgi:hypothetical protein
MAGVAIQISSAVVVNSFFILFLLSQRIHLSRPVRDLDLYTITAPLGSAVLKLSHVRHGAEQPNSRSHQHGKKPEKHRILDVAVALIFRRLRPWLFSVRRHH